MSHADVVVAARVDRHLAPLLHDGVITHGIGKVADPIPDIQRMSERRLTLCKSECGVRHHRRPNLFGYPPFLGTHMSQYGPRRTTIDGPCTGRGRGPFAVCVYGAPWWCPVLFCRPGRRHSSDCHSSHAVLGYSETVCASQLTRMRPWLHQRPRSWRWPTRPMWPARRWPMCWAAYRCSPNAMQIPASVDPRNHATHDTFIMEIRKWLKHLCRYTGN